MHKYLSIIALAGFAASQSLAGLPACATKCVADGLPSNCNLDPKCICESASFIEAISCCVSKECNQNDQEATLTYARTICNPAGVSNLPLSATCSSTASGSSSTASSSSSTASDAASSASDAASSASESASSVASSASEAAGSASSSAEAAATSAAGGGAGMLGVGMGEVLGAGLLGVAALL